MRGKVSGIGKRSRGVLGAQPVVVRQKGCVQFAREAPRDNWSIIYQPCDFVGLAVVKRSARHRHEYPASV